jgi:pyrroloquinoline quinone (PQQ) biosynthesis protein C
MRYMDVQALNVELSKDLYDWLRAKAQADARTLKATLQLIIEDAMREDQEAVA